VIGCVRGEFRSRLADEKRAWKQYTPQKTEQALENPRKVVILMVQSECEGGYRDVFCACDDRVTRHEKAYGSQLNKLER
jgi:hypothetical protein